MTEQKQKGKLAAVRIRGKVNVDTVVVDTMNMLKLYNKNYCVILKNTPSIEGMLKKAKDYITWGEVDDDTIKMLEEKRGEKDPKDEKKLKPFFRLNPPRGGFERKGIKNTFSFGGALGYRGEKINNLIRRML